MPAIMDVRSDEERQLRIRVAADYHTLTEVLGGAIDAHARLRDADGRVTALRARRSPVQSAPVHVKWPLLGLAVCAAYVIDVLMVGPAADFLASNTLADYPPLMHAARFVLPAAVIAFELCIAYAIAEARENAALGLGSRQTYVRTAAAGISLSLAVPMLAGALALTSSSEQPGLVGVALFVGQMLLAAAPHVLIVAGSGQQVRAVFAILSERRERRAEAEVADSRRVVQAQHASVVRAFNEFSGNLAQITRLFPGSGALVFAFSPEERAELRCSNDGEPVVAEPERATDRRPAPSPSPTPVPAPNPAPPVGPDIPVDGIPADGDEYLRRVLRRRQADDDGIVS
jgi:hypothetical protein